MERPYPLQFELLQATEHAAELRFRAGPPRAGVYSDEPRPVAGRVIGPRCAYARTLPSTYEWRPEASPAGGPPQAYRATIPDPCYWTSELPFLYDVEVELRGANDRSTAAVWPLGLRRVESRGGSLLVERRRTVLRGAALQSADEGVLRAARAAGAAVALPHPDVATLRQGSEIGVDIVADMRGAAAHAQALAWQPAVVLAIVDASQAANPWPGVAACQAVSAAEVVEPILAPWARVLAFELATGERPPAWARDCGRPVVAIRRGQPYADMAAARGACDGLQAELAPEFDLAGYL